MRTGQWTTTAPVSAIRSSSPSLSQTAHRRVGAAPRRQGADADGDAAIGGAVPPLVKVRRRRGDGIGGWGSPVQIGPAAGQEHAQTDGFGGLGGSIDVGGGAAHLVVLDHGRGPAAQVLHQAQQAGQADLLGRHRRFDGPDHLLQPIEEGLVVGQTAKEGLGQVGMAVDQSGQHGHVGRVDATAGAARQVGRGIARAHTCDAIRLHPDPAAGVGRVPAVHGEDGSAFDQQRGHTRGTG